MEFKLFRGLLTSKLLKMRKVLFLGTFLLVASLSAFAGDNTPGKQAKECPNGCSTDGNKCCTTKAGSTYYGRL